LDSNVAFKLCLMAWARALMSYSEHRGSLEPHLFAVRVFVVFTAAVAIQAFGLAATERNKFWATRNA